MKLARKCTCTLNRLCSSADKYGGWHTVTAKQRPHLRKAHGNRETPGHVAGEQVGGGALPARYPVLATAKNGEQVPRCFLFPCEFIDQPPLLGAALEMPFQHRTAAPSSLPASPRRGPPVLAVPVLNAHRSACWAVREAWITAWKQHSLPPGAFRAGRE